MITLDVSFNLVQRSTPVKAKNEPTHKVTRIELPKDGNFILPKQVTVILYPPKN